ncbi:EAL domain-containing protein [Devosia ginsengisoli]|uniref:EAL domain-containing protein n=1 Tax=Devosia ginsengisoli TaxID=400770 RepID=A0A5B8LZC1_9HYPH|nr:EAL domain-containing protein [Devosia ginsengisoli]
MDRSFVARLGSDRASDVVVGSIIDIARKLDMKLVAGGIETPEQARILSELRLRHGAGLSLCLPRPREDDYHPPAVALRPEIRRHRRPPLRLSAVALFARWRNLGEVSDWTKVAWRPAPRDRTVTGTPPILPVTNAMTFWI